MKHIIIIVQFALLGLLTGCGGGSESKPETPPTNLSSSDNQTDDSQGTQQLVADELFDFRVDKDITVLLANLPETHGVIKIYHGTDFYDAQSNIHYPDGKTLLANWRPSNTMQINITFNNNWEGLLIEWLPESGFEKEQYMFFPASEINNELLVSIKPDSSL